MFNEIDNLVCVYIGRCAIHVAVLHQNEETVEYIASNFRQTLRMGDNVSGHLFF